MGEGRNVPEDSASGPTPRGSRSHRPAHGSQGRGHGTGKGEVVSADEIRLPYRDAGDPFDLAAIDDDLAEQFPDDPTERRVQNEVAYDLLIGNTPSTIGEAIDLLERATPRSRRDLLDRARQRAGLPTLTEEQARQAPQDADVRSGRREQHVARPGRPGGGHREGEEREAPLPRHAGRPPPSRIG